MTQSINPKTIDGSDINGTQIKTVVSKGQMLLQVGARSVATSASAGDFPRYAGSTQDPRTVEVEHIIEGSGAVYRTNLEYLKGLYDRKHGRRTFVFDLDGVEVSVSVVLVNLDPHGSGVTKVAAKGTWLLESSVYYATGAALTDTDSGSGAGALSLSTTGGAVRGFVATYTLEATALRLAANGQRHGYPITLINRSRKAFHKDFVDLFDNEPGGVGTYGSIDHQNLTERGTSDGTDFEVWDVEKGERVAHWWPGAGLGGPDELESTIGAGLDLAPARSWQIAQGAAVADSDTEIVVRGDFGALPALPFFVGYRAGSDEEVWRVDAIEVYEGGGTAKWTVQRDARGTSAPVSLADGTKVFLASRILWVILGHTSPPDQTYIDDDEKPVVYDATGGRSTNGYLRYEVFSEAVSANRPLDFLPRIGSWRLRDLKEPDRLDHDREKLEAKGDLYSYFFPYTGGLATDAVPTTHLALAYSATVLRRFASRFEVELPYRVDDVTYDYDATTLGYGILDREGKLVLRGETAEGQSIVLDEQDDSSGSDVNVTPAEPVSVIASTVEVYDPKVDDYSSVSAGQPTDGDGVYTQNIRLGVVEEEQPIPIRGALQEIYQWGRPDSDDGPLTIENDDGDTLELRGLITGLNEPVEIDVATRTVTVDGIAYNAFVGGDYPPIKEGPAAATVTVTDSRTPGSWSVEVSYRRAYS